MGFDSSCKLLLGYNLHEISSLFSGGQGGGGGGGKKKNVINLSSAECS